MKLSIFIFSIIILGGCITINKCNCNCECGNQLEWETLGNNVYVSNNSTNQVSDVNLGAFNDKRYVWMYWNESTNKVNRTVK